MTLDMRQLPGHPGATPALAEGQYWGWGRCGNPAYPHPHPSARVTRQKLHHDPTPRLRGPAPRRGGYLSSDPWGAEPGLSCEPHPPAPRSPSCLPLGVGRSICKPGPVPRRSGCPARSGPEARASLNLPRTWGPPPPPAKAARAWFSRERSGAARPLESWGSSAHSHCRSWLHVLVTHQEGCAPHGSRRADATSARLHGLPEQSGRRPAPARPPPAPPRHRPRPRRPLVCSTRRRTPGQGWGLHGRCSPGLPK